MGNRTLEYDNHKGFRCQRCREWTLGGHLYSSSDNERICFLCHIEDVSNEMLNRHTTREQTLVEVEKVSDLAPSEIVEKTPAPVASTMSDRTERDSVATGKIGWIADLI